MENENGGNLESVETPETQVAEQPAIEEKTFTQDELNSIIGERLERSNKKFLEKYGVESFEELDAKLKSLDEAKQQLESKISELNTLSEEKNQLTESHKNLIKQYAYLNNNIKDSKIADIEAIFKGKELDINDENLKAELKDHPEWVKPIQTIKKLSLDDEKTNNETDDIEKLNKYFGVNF